ncbi:hypothetical protein Tco_1447469 [Tanacetum coccineum]
MGKQQEKEYVKLKSNYINKKVDTTDAVREDEKLVARSIFDMQGNRAEEVFNDDEGVILLSMNVQTVAPGK